MTSANLGPTPHRGGSLAVPRLHPAAIGTRGLAAGVRRVAVLVGLAAAGVIAGWLIANGDTQFVLAALIPLPVIVVALHRRVSGPLAGLMLLLILNGIPGINLGGRLPSNIRVQDVGVLALALLLFAYRDRSGQAETSPYVRVARIWSAVFVGWWTLTLARSVLLEGIPVRLAASYGRDFLYFGILLPLALGARLPERSLRIAGLIVLIAAVAYATGQTIAGLTGVTLSWLVHPLIVADATGQLTRFYSPMNYVVDTLLFFSGALYLSKQAPGDRRVLGVVVAVLAAAGVLGLTRANYFGIVVAIVVGSVVYMRRHGSATAVLVRAIVVILVAIAGATLFTAITGSSTSLVNNPVASRISKGVSDVSQSSGTFGSRKRTDEEIVHLLGSNWPIGLGFLNPAAHYVSSLPSGSIRSSDTGVFNALATLGLVGVLLIFAPVAYAWRELLRVSRRTWGSAQALPRWVLYGGVMWIAWAVASSLTLDLFFSTPGVAVAAVGLAALGRMLAMAKPVQPALAAAEAGPSALLAPSNGTTLTPRSGRGSARQAAKPGPGSAREAARPGRPCGPSAGRPPRAASAPMGGLAAPTHVADLAPAPVADLAPSPMPDLAPTQAPAPTDSPAIQVSSIAMPLSVVIVTYNSSHCVSDCIKGLRTVLGHCEIIVVDNLSDDDTTSAVWATDQRVRILSKGRNAGYGSACNSGVRAARNDHVMLMNPDVVLKHADRDSLLAALSETPFGLLAPSIDTDMRGPPRPQTFAPSSWVSELGVMALGPFRPRALPHRSRLAETATAAWVSGALMLVARSEFMALGGFDNRFFLYYEDQELGHRYREAGLPIRSTSAITAAHRGGHSVAGNDDHRVVAMAWCVAGWIELVAMRYGMRRAKLSWAAIRAAHGAGRRLAEWGGEVGGLPRLRRKAEQLRSVDAVLAQIARDGFGSGPSACPAARRILLPASKR